MPRHAGVKGAAMSVSRACSAVRSYVSTPFLYYVLQVSAEDVEIARQFGAAVAADDREGVYSLFADDIEYTTAHRTLRGITEIREKLKWGEPPDNLDVVWDYGEWDDLGGGRVVSESRRILRWKETGEVATVMRVRVDIQIREGRITRIERRALPDEDELLEA